jgi:hypothetical protein
MAETLDQFLLNQSKAKAAKKDVPLMMDESYFPDQGQVISENLPKGVGIPIKGATLNAQGKVVAPIQGIGVSGANKPIEQSKVDELKAIFKTPEEPAPMPQAPAPAPIPEKKKEEPKKGFDWASLLPALAPLAVEGLLGTQAAGTAGEGAAIASKYILDEEAKKEARKKEFENKIIEMQQARDLASIKASGKQKPLTAANTLPYLDEEGKVRYALIEEALGKEKPAERPKGLTFQEQLQLRNVGASERNTREEKRAIERAGSRFQQSLNANKEYQGLQSQIANADKAIEYLSQGKNIADEGAKKVFAKGIFGDVGNIAVQEAAAIAENPSIYNKYATLKAKFEQGVKFGDVDRADMMEFATMIRNAAPRKMKEIADRLAAAETNISGRDVSKIANSLVTVPDSQYPKVRVVVFDKKTKKNYIHEIDPKDYPRAVREKGAKLYIGKK